MRHRVLSSALLVAAALAPLPAPAQQAAGPTVKTTVDEVLLDLIVRDKKGKPVTDLKPDDITVLDNGAKQTLTSFRLVSGVRSGHFERRQDGARSAAPDSPGDARLRGDDRSRPAQTGAHRRHRSDQGRSRDQRVLRGGGDQHPALSSCSSSPTTKRRSPRPSNAPPEGITGSGFASESDAIQAELKRNLGGQNGADQPGNLLSAASQTASQPVANGSDALQAKLASVMLDMLRLDAASPRRARASRSPRCGRWWMASDRFPAESR